MSGSGRRPDRRRGALRGALGVLTLTLMVVPLLGSGRDRGVLLELDRHDFALQARDLADGSLGPRLPVVLGSPAHPTPKGVFPVFTVVRNPGWKPGPLARSFGAHPVPPSSEGPLGVGKIPFAPGGVALHGGADPLLLGKPVSLGCVRARNADFLALIAWLEERGALEREGHRVRGELRQSFLRPARVVVR